MAEKNDETHGGSIVRGRVLRCRDGEAKPVDDWLAVEEPLEIRLSWVRDGVRVVRPVSVTMRTPGADRDLAAGFLFGEAIVERAEDIETIEEQAVTGVMKGQRVTVSLRDGVGFDAGRLARHFYTTSSCGVCGKAALEALRLTGCQPMTSDGPAISAGVLSALPDTLREAQAAFDATGGLHAAGLFSPEGRLDILREDVGRHNAVDKVVGAALREGRLPASQSLLFVSSRLSFEILQKAIRAGIPVSASAGAPSSLAVELAGAFGVTLAGFVRGGRFNIYAGSQRFPRPDAYSNKAPTGRPVTKEKS